MTLALFDLDNTLIGGDSDDLWGEFVVHQGLVDGDRHRQTNEAFYRDYQQGTLDVAAYLRFALAPLTQYTADELCNMHRQFMADCIDPIWLPRAVNLVEEHRRLGHRLLIITATNRFVAEPIARRFNIADLICSEPEKKGDFYTGNFVGTPCYGAGKVVKVGDWLRNHPEETLDGAWFYSDSHNDIPLLSLVANPFVVDADPTLLQKAKSLNWPAMSLREKLPI